MKQIKSMDDVKKVLIELHSHKTSIAKKEAVLNKKVQELMENFDKETKEDLASCDVAEKLLKKYCKTNKQLFKDKNTLLFEGIAKMGYRLGNPKVSFAQTKTTEENVIKKMKKELNDYVGYKESIERGKILADYAAGKLSDKQLANAGLKVDQSQKFFIDVIMIKAEDNAR